MADSVGPNGQVKIQKCAAAGNCSLYLQVSGNVGQLAVDNSGNIYMLIGTNSGNALANAVVVKCTAAGNCTNWTYGTNPGLGYPNGIAVDSTNNVYISDYNNGRVQVCDPRRTASIIASSPGLELLDPDWFSSVKMVKSVIPIRLQ